MTGLRRNYVTYKWVRPEHLNAGNVLHGARLIGWVDEYAAIYTHLILPPGLLALTKRVGSIEFLSAVHAGQALEFDIELAGLGRTSITLDAHVSVFGSDVRVAEFSDIVFVTVDADLAAVPHLLEPPPE